MAQNFTDVVDVIIALEIYTHLTHGASLRLSQFPSIAQQRWNWFVDNWEEYKERFVENANGNEDELLSLEKLEKEVVSYKLGNKLNPLENKTLYKAFKVFFDQIEIGEINTTTAEQKVISDEVNKISDYREGDFRNAYDFLKTAVLSLEFAIGLGDETVAELYGVTNIEKQRSATISDLSLISEIREIMGQISGLIYNLQINQKRPPNLLNIANTNLDGESRISIADIYQTYIPRPFEISLEHMAKKYLGSSRLWYELVTINNLQPPFVDEVGEKTPLLAPAAANNLTISIDRRYSIGPGIFVNVGSYRYNEESRIIEKIVYNEENESMILFLSGEQDLNRFTPNEGGFVRIYEPHTTRKGRFVLIPTPVGADGDTSSQKTPTKDELRRLDNAYINFGIDVYKDEKTRDWIFDQTGNFRLAAGIKSIKQAVTNALKTRIGELPFHPRYGINYKLGEQYFGRTLDDAVVFADIIRLAILKDPRFEQALITNIGTTPTGISLQVSVKISGIDAPIPLSFIS